MLQLNIFADPATLPSRSYTHLPLQLGRARRFQRLVATRCAHNYWEDTPPPPSRCGAAKLIARRCKTLRETMATALSACASVRLAKYAFCTSGYITTMSGGTNLHSHSPLYTFIHNFLVFLSTLSSLSSYQYNALPIAGRCPRRPSGVSHYPRGSSERVQPG